LVDTTGLSPVGYKLYGFESRPDYIINHKRIGHELLQLNKWQMGDRLE
jgi:hypothetical protein